MTSGVGRAGGGTPIPPATGGSDTPLRDVDGIITSHIDPTKPTNPDFPFSSIELKAHDNDGATQGRSLASTAMVYGMVGASVGKFGFDAWRTGLKIPEAHRAPRYDAKLATGEPVLGARFLPKPVQEEIRHPLARYGFLPHSVQPGKLLPTMKPPVDHVDTEGLGRLARTGKRAANSFRRIEGEWRTTKVPVRDLQINRRLVLALRQSLTAQPTTNLLNPALEGKPVSVATRGMSFTARDLAMYRRSMLAGAALAGWQLFTGGTNALSAAKRNGNDALLNTKEGRTGVINAVGGGATVTLLGMEMFRNQPLKMGFLDRVMAATKSGLLTHPATTGALFTATALFMANEWGFLDSFDEHEHRSVGKVVSDAAHHIPIVGGLLPGD